MTWVYYVAAIGAILTLATVTIDVAPWCRTLARVAAAGTMIGVGVAVIRSAHRRRILAVICVLLITAGLFAEGLSSLGVPGIWFPWGTGVSRTQFAYAALAAGLGVLLMRPISRMASTTAACLVVGVGASLAPARPVSAAAPAFSTAELWTPRAISSENFESSPTFSPDGREVYFFRADRAFDNYRLFMSRCTDDGWSVPTAVTFAASEGVAEADPFITHDGKHLLFASTRGSPEKRGDDFDIWQVDRLPDGRWGTPRQLPKPVNSSDQELLPRMLPDGRLIFGSNRPGGLGRGDIYLATPGATGWVVENMGSPVNTAGNELEAEISRDGNRLIVVAAREQLWHLYIYELAGKDRWQMSGQVAADNKVFQVGPLFSPRADRLLFAQASGDRSGELFLVDLVKNPDRTWPPSCKPLASD